MTRKHFSELCDLMCSTLPGRGSGQVVSVLAFHSDDSSSNPAEVFNFPVKIDVEKD